MTTAPHLTNHSTYKTFSRSSLLVISHPFCQNLPSSAASTPYSSSSSSSSIRTRTVSQQDEESSSSALHRLLHSSPAPWFFIIHHDTWSWLNDWLTDWLISDHSYTITWSPIWLDSNSLRFSLFYWYISGTYLPSTRALDGVSFVDIEPSDW